MNLMPYNLMILYWLLKNIGEFLMDRKLTSICTIFTFNSLISLKCYFTYCKVEKLESDYTDDIFKIIKEEVLYNQFQKNQ